MIYARTFPWTYVETNHTIKGKLIITCVSYNKPFFQLNKNVI